MATQVLKQFEVESTTVFRLRDVLPTSAWKAFSTDAAVVSSDRAEDRSCTKGLMVALLLEAVVAAGAYGLWQVWHFIR
jgi:hypothetical protein